jgi:hypothetical protein
MIDSITSFLNSPVPYFVSTSNDALYAIDVIGGGAIAFFLWWIFCFALRNGTRGTTAALRIIQRRRKVDLKMIFLNKWKVEGSNEDSLGPVDLREPDDLRKL